MSATSYHMIPRIGAALLLLALPASTTFALDAKQWSAAAKSSRAAAQEQARRNNFAARGYSAAGAPFELVGARAGNLIYYQALTANAAITANTTPVRNTTPYNVTGTGIAVGVWDAGAIRFTHEALTPRVTNGDGYMVVDPVGTAHATSVAGIIGASFIAPANYVGMAPAVSMIGHHFENDRAEMIAVAAAVANDPGKIVLSNHAYGITSGWELGTYSGNSGYHFFGTFSPPLTESDLFGQNCQEAAELDQICYDYPYYLPVISAGNDRDDGAPASGAPFYYYTFDGVDYTWHLVSSYDSSLHPLADSTVNGGFDTIQPYAGGKNTLCVGAIGDGVTAGVRDLTKASMAVFSGWGPMDDGRIKPDVVANGLTIFGLRALADSGPTAYRAAADLNGTSFSAPVVTGSAALLHELYGDLFAGQQMRASTMKALIIHTADDLTNTLGLGNPAARVGPDYSTGWGAMNTQAAADLLRDQALNATHLRLRENFLDATYPTRTMLLDYSGSGPIRATICWTDPSGTVRTTLDDRTPVLINDLDLRIISPSVTTYYPWVLDVLNPSNGATTGDNIVDNVEQVVIDAPSAGQYTITVSHKGGLSGGTQYYSIMLDGLIDNGGASVRDWLRFSAD
ncbi:S8 family serine peptidase [Candidatus Sumerlaeota bacterium]|nr:S8 family serine peptidase [Candidatus Sumerlaeota bacterium]